MLTTVTRMQVGQYAEFRGRQTSGAPETMNVCGNISCPSLSLAWIGP